MSKLLKAIAGIVVVVAIGGAYFYPKFVAPLGNNAVGTTFNSAKVAEIVFAPLTAAASSTSLYNGDASDRIITDGFISCSGLGTSKSFASGGVTGIATFTIGAATTSVANTGLQANANLIFDSVTNTVATTTAWYYGASTSPGVTGNGAFQRIWKSGSYLTFTSNATNTATCLVGVHYLGS